MAKKMTSEGKIENEAKANLEAVKGFDFEGTQGEVSVGKGSVLELAVGEAAGPFTIANVEENVFLTDDKDAKPVTCYTAKDANGVPWRLPVSSIFVAHCRELGVAKGDKIAIKRETDVLKEKGRGKGNPMKFFLVKLLSKA